MTLENLHALDGAVNIDKVGVSESSWLTSASVNGNADIDDVSDITEELVEISIRHLEGKVSDEESLGWGVCGFLPTGLVLVVDDKTAAFEYFLMLGLDGSGGLLEGFEFDVSESLSTLATMSSEIRVESYPLLMPLGSLAMTADLISPN